MKMETTIDLFRHFGNHELVYGTGSLKSLIHLAQQSARLFVVSGRHFPHTDYWKALEAGFRSTGIEYQRETVSGEPTPEMVDELTAMARDRGAGAVVAIGGGSVLDAGKAVAAMLRHEGSVIEYLEGIGKRKPRADSAPMIAVPTTAGTGSEATNNAVISRRGKNGFKKSLRHNAFIPRTVLLDPALALGCPPEVSLACAMDAFCQLLESAISTKATPFTAFLAREGFKYFGRGSRLFSDRLYGKDNEIYARGELTLSAYFSGLTLSNAGLGAVHGLAGPLGAACDVPHGVACGLLVIPVFRRMINRLTDDPQHRHTMSILEDAASILFSCELTAMLDRIDYWAMGLPCLSAYGLKKEQLDAVIQASDSKNFPVRLSEEDLRSALNEVL
ncbi:MAG: hypothetical protein B6D68_00835 [spirochete symbiont of Stewartia floridana]|nr:MAG: hypothetical protein B6D68_00835 [spirochete symbiont of Stewartia floridana]